MSRIVRVRRLRVPGRLGNLTRIIHSLFSPPRLEDTKSTKKANERKEITGLRDTKLAKKVKNKERQEGKEHEKDSEPGLTGFSGEWWAKAHPTWLELLRRCMNQNRQGKTIKGQW